MRMAIESSFLKPRHQNASQTMRMAIDCILTYLKISEKNSKETKSDPNCHCAKL